MFLNIDISQADFAMTRAGLSIELNQEYDSTKTRNMAGCQPRRKYK